MGRSRRINHRVPPRSAGRPKIVRPRDGSLVEAHPEPVFEPEAVTVLRRQLQTAEREATEAVKEAELRLSQLNALKQVLQDTRDAAVHARLQQEQQSVEAKLPQRVEIVTADDIRRQGDEATMTVLANVDGTVGELEVTIPVEQLKQLIQRKRANGKAARAKTVSEVRSPDEEGDVQD